MRWMFRIRVREVVDTRIRMRRRPRSRLRSRIRG